ncbi:MAG: hypothetical protein IPH93_03145 [Saprospiraceae bacterium]|nr:hypothetical protein [Saprospiraceae bacterium]
MGKENFIKLYKTIQDGILTKLEDRIIDELLVDCSKEDKVKLATSFLSTIVKAAINYTGKSEHAERAGIFPVIQEGETFRIENLPGSDFAAFGGFASYHARKACFEKAKVDAVLCLSQDHFRKYHYKNMLKYIDEFYMSYVDSSQVASLLKNHKMSYVKAKNEFSQNYEDNILSKLRKPFIDRIHKLFNDAISIWLKIIAAGALIFKSKEIFINRLPEIKFSDAISKSSNIAVKFRYKDLSNKITLKVNDVLVVTAYHDKYNYFKLYLAQSEPILDMNDSDILDKCYLSTLAKRPNDYIPEGVVNSIQIGNSNVLLLDNLNFLQNDIEKLVFGINPVVEVEIDSSNNISLSKIADLSISLHKEILDYKM